MASSVRLNKRRHRRKAAKVPVAYHRVARSRTRNVEDEPGRISNYSDTGFCLVAERPLSVGEILTLKIPRSVLSGSGKIVHGRVCWSRNAGQEGGYAAGLRLVRPVIKNAPRPVSGTRTPTPVSGKPRNNTRTSTNLLVKVRRISEDSFLEDAPHGGRVSFLNTGMVLTCRRKYPPGCILELEFPATAKGDQEVMRVKVEWTQSGPQPDTYRLCVTALDAE